MVFLSTCGSNESAVKSKAQRGIQRADFGGTELCIGEARVSKTAEPFMWLLIRIIHVACVMKGYCKTVAHLEHIWHIHIIH